VERAGSAAEPPAGAKGAQRGAPVGASAYCSAAEGGTRDRVRQAGALRGGACALLRQGSSPDGRRRDWLVMSAACRLSGSGRERA
jgi:hypothetical protein